MNSGWFKLPAPPMPYDQNSIKYQVWVMLENGIVIGATGIGPRHTNQYSYVMQTTLHGAKEMLVEFQRYNKINFQDTYFPIKPNEWIDKYELI